MRIGQRITNAVVKAIRYRDKSLVILSKHSISSDWVEREVMLALKEEDMRGQVVLFPIRIDDEALNASNKWTNLLHDRNIGDFTDSKKYAESLEILLRSLSLPQLPKR